jgi:hypothetical protein
VPPARSNTAHGNGLVKTGLVVGTIAVNAAAGLLIVSADDQPGQAHLPPAPIAPPVAQLVPAPPPPVLSAPKPKPVPEAGFVIRRILPIDGPMRYGQWYWDDKGVPDGPLVITVDLEARVLSVFRDGYEIGTSVVLTGAEEKPTPTGIFPITQKDANHHSSLYNDAPMPYMQRLTNDGVTIHGDDVVENGYASHGCVGVPTPFAKKLFGITHLGDKVYITRGRRVGLGDALVKK